MLIIRLSGLGQRKMTLLIPVKVLAGGFFGGLMLGARN
jgi:hypothetical protein